MTQMRTIEIDFDIHQMIELERKGFDEPENEALRRLLKLPEKAAATATQPTSAPPPVLPGLTRAMNEHVKRAWSGKGVELPHGTELRMEYNGQVFRGSIDNGIWIVEGKRSNSPSDAASSVAVTKTGTHPSLNGWIYWEVKRPTDSNWRTLKSLKSRK